MAWTFAANLIATASLSSEAFYNILATAKLAGWTCPADSDGTTYSAVGGQLTHGLTGAGGMCNSKAWFVMRDPAGLRSFCIQRDTTQSTIYTARVKYSPAAGFVGGSPSATQVPSATDEVVLQGSGTDAAPGFADFFGNGNTVGFRQHMGFGDASVGYSFWHIATGNQLSLGTTCANFALDVLKAGSYVPGNADPAVIWTPWGSGSGNYSQQFFYDTTFSTNGRAKAFVGAVNAANWLGVTPMNPYCGTYGILAGGPGGGAGWPNGTNGKDRVFSPIYSRYAGSPTATGTVGVSSLFKASLWSRQVGDLLTKTTFGDYLCISQNFIVPWDGTLIRQQ